MKIYDISREFFSTPVYPGDPKPKRHWISRLEEGEDCNLSEYSACSHTATHVDAPKHFLADGFTVESMELERFYGPCTVISVQGAVSPKIMEEWMKTCRQRLLLKGQEDCYLTRESACAISSEILLIGTDAASIGGKEDESGPHMELLQRNIAILEGLNLEGVPDGEYTLCAFPIKMKDAEAAPVRAVLIQNDD